MEPVERILSLIKKQGMTQKTFAAHLGIRPQAITEWKQGITRSYKDRLPEIAQLLQTSVDYILTGNEPSQSSSALRIPVLGTIPAGIPLEAIEDIHDWEEIPAAWADGGREYFGLQVKGDSMYPQYLEGDTVILRKATTCDSGDDCAVLVNGDEATLKRVFLHEGGAIELRPVNTAYPPRTYTPAEVEDLPVQLIGVVVELRRKIK